MRGFIILSNGNRQQLGILLTFLVLCLCVSPVLLTFGAVNTFYCEEGLYFSDDRLADKTIPYNALFMTLIN